MEPEISVVIPVLSGEHHLNDCLKSLETQDTIHFEVIIVLNPKDSAWPRIEPNNLHLTRLTSDIGANSARNMGLKCAKADLVLFLDADCLINDSYFLKRYVDHMRKFEFLTGVGGPYSLNIHADKIAKAYHLIQMRWLFNGVYSEDYFTDHLLGGNLVLRKSKLLQQKFDEKMKFGSTEFEFLRRLSQNNHQFQLITDQKVIHQNDLTVKSFTKKAYLQGQGFRYLLEKNGDLMVRDLKLLTTPEPTTELMPLLKLYDQHFMTGAELNINLISNLYRWTKQQIETYKELVKIVAAH